MSKSLQYINQGRGGTLVYTDDRGKIQFDWEFGGGHCVAIIFVPETTNWERATGRQVEERMEVLTFVAQQAIRDQSPKSTYTISEKFIELWNQSAATDSDSVTVSSDQNSVGGKSSNIPASGTIDFPAATKEIQEDNLLKKRIKQISMVFFVLSLTQKAYCTTTNCSDSIMVFLLGWAAIFSTGAGICWFANPLLFGSWFLLKKNLKLSMFMGMTSALLALFFLMFSSIVDNEGAIPHPIISYNMGYWLWVCSTVTMLIGTYVLMYRHNVRNKTVARVRHF